MDIGSETVFATLAEAVGRVRELDRRAADTSLSLHERVVAGATADGMRAALRSARTALAASLADEDD